MLVDLPDKTVNTIAGAVRDLQVVSIGIGGLVWRRPWMPGEQICDYRVHHSAIVGDRRVELRIRGNASKCGNAHCFALTFIRGKPERSIFLDRSAE